MSKFFELSPKAPWIRWLFWSAAILSVVFAALDLAGQHWMRAARTAAMACVYALFPKFFAGTPTKAQQTRYLILLLVALALSIWHFLTRAA